MTHDVHFFSDLPRLRRDIASMFGALPQRLPVTLRLAIQLRLMPNPIAVTHRALFAALLIASSTLSLWTGLGLATATSTAAMATALAGGTVLVGTAAIHQYIAGLNRSAHSRGLLAPLLGIVEQSVRAS